MNPIVIIGGVAAGMSAASQAKRRRPDAEVVVLERGPYVSYGACGIPYNLADPARPIEDLVVITAERFRRERGIDVRTGHEALAIDGAAKVVRARELANGREYTLDYDKLVIATGARASRLPLPGVDLPNVMVLRELTDGARIKARLANEKLESALLIGAGYIGAELAEALRVRGVEVTMLEKSPQVLPGFERPLAKVAEDELALRGVRVVTGVELRALDRANGGRRVVARTDRGDFEADLAVISVGVRPNVELAQKAGVRLGDTGAIAVDDHMRTSAPDVFAAGDCAEAHHLVSGRATWIPLGTTANKQGKVAGANAVGADERFAGIVGTAAFKVFDVEVGRTGLGASELGKLGIDAVTALSKQRARGYGESDARELSTVLFAERGSGRLLGAQMAGAGVVAKRIDVLAAALHAGMSVYDVAALDLSYAPPFAPVYDPVLIAATVAIKKIEE